MKAMSRLGLHAFLLTELPEHLHAWLLLGQNCKGQEVAFLSGLLFRKLD